MSMQAESGSSTRERLLEAAGEVFAEKGFRKATVREIVGRAGANLSAVNYHFRDKQGLYQAVLEWGHKSLAEDEELRRARDARLAPEQRLRAFVLGFLLRGLSTERRPHYARLMAMEMAEPTTILEMVVERFIRPRFELLVSIVRGVVGNNLPRRTLELCAESIVGQCVHLVHGRPIIVRVMPHLSYSREDIERLAEHVTQFCLAALKHLPAQPGGAK